MSRKKTHHRYLQYLAFLVLCISLGLAFYYYMNSPLYQGAPDQSKPDVQGATARNVKKPVQIVTEALIIHIPDGVQIRMRDTLGRYAGYNAHINGFENDIPYSEVISSENGDKYIRISHKIAPYYTMLVEGKNSSEAIFIELKNSESHTQSELVSLDDLPIEGASYDVKLNPFSVTKVDNYVQ